MVADRKLLPGRRWLFTKPPSNVTIVTIDRIDTVMIAQIGGIIAQTDEIIAQTDGIIGKPEIITVHRAVRRPMVTIKIIVHTATSQNER